ncbi:MAG: hypothetical protein Q8S18_12665 [Bacteroidales bacterium]|nr:hypothetical protein [Bacteroidales bacterium]
MKLVKKTGIFNPDGEIVLHPDISVSWQLLGEKNIPELPPGIHFDIDVFIDEHTLLSGECSIVWATYDLRQADVLSNALLAQNITSVLGRIKMNKRNLLLIIIDNIKDTAEAIDFIWRKESGLRLKPDWAYADGEPNKSFEKWLNG